MFFANNWIIRKAISFSKTNRSGVSCLSTVSLQKVRRVRNKPIATIGRVWSLSKLYNQMITFFIVRTKLDLYLKYLKLVFGFSHFAQNIEHAILSRLFQLHKQLKFRNWPVIERNGNVKNNFILRRKTEEEPSAWCRRHEMSVLHIHRFYFLRSP